MTDCTLARRMHQREHVRQQRECFYIRRTTPSTGTISDIHAIAVKAVCAHSLRRKRTTVFLPKKTQVDDQSITSSTTVKQSLGPIGFLFGLS